jgi:hypothetical protein
MFMADELPSVDVHHRRSRRRSARGRFARRVKQAWRRTKVRRAILTLILAAGAVVGGYKVTMYMMAHQVNLNEFRTGNGN